MKIFTHIPQKKRKISYTDLGRFTQLCLRRKQSDGKAWKTGPSDPTFEELAAWPQKF